MTEDDRTRTLPASFSIFNKLTFSFCANVGFRTLLHQYVVVCCVCGRVYSSSLPRCGLVLTARGRGCLGQITRHQQPSTEPAAWTPARPVSGSLCPAEDALRAGGGAPFPADTASYYSSPPLLLPRLWLRRNQRQCGKPFITRPQEAAMITFSLPEGHTLLSTKRRSINQSRACIEHAHIVSKQNPR